MNNELYFYPQFLTKQEAEQTKLNHPMFENNLSPKRRSVIAGVLSKTSEGRDVILVGKSECSFKDAFVKKTGRKIAKGRALSSHPLTVIELEANTSHKDAVTQFVNYSKSL